MASSSKANVILACGAGGLKPYEKYLEEFGWTLCFHDAENLCCLARLGQEGSIQQIAGRREVDPSTRESLMQSLGKGYIEEGVCCIPARGTFLSKSHRTWRLQDTCKDGYNQNSYLSCQQWRCRYVTCDHRRMSSHYALGILCASGDYLWRCSEDGIPEVRPTIHLGHVNLWTLGFGLTELSWYWIHSWRRMLHGHFRSSGISIGPWFLCVWEIRIWRKNKWRFFFRRDRDSDSRCPWWSGLSPLIFPTKRRRVSRVMLEGRNEQTRGRQIRRRGKQRERLEPGLEVYSSSDMITPVIAGYFPAGLMTVSIGASYCKDWALLIVNWVDYGFTITLEHRLSDHSWLYFPCCFFSC